MISFEQVLRMDEAELSARGLNHTPFEIAQQPALWRELVPSLQDFVASVRDFWDKERPVVLVGAGTSAYAAQAVALTLKQRGWSRAEAVASTEIVLDPAALLPREPFTMISFARSGNSPEGNAAFALASTLHPDTRHIVITCNRDGELARIARAEGEAHARLFVLPEQADDRGLAMTSSFTGMVVAGQALAYAEQFERFADGITHIATVAESLLQHESDTLSQLAHLPFERAVFIGADIQYVTALESHLKVQELSDGRVVAKAESLLGIRHGPMTVIDDETLVCVFLSGDTYVHSYERDLLRELQAKRLGLKTVVCAPHSSNASYPTAPDSTPPGTIAPLEQLADVVIRLGASAADTASASTASSDAPFIVSNHLWITPAVLVGQIVGLMKSVALGLTPDAPSDGDVISRVVQGVTIYPYSRTDTM